MMPPPVQGEKPVQDIPSVSYVPQSPAWAQPPSHSWSLMEVKNGVEFALHKLSCQPGRNIIVIGRDAQADIVLQHASISRFHARIAFDKEQGSPWLRDLSSSHGVFVNKRRLPPNSIGRDESVSSVAGSRGVIIFPGDIIQLGASTRYFCVVGPAEFERPWAAKRTLRQEQLQDCKVVSTSGARLCDSEVSGDFSDNEGGLNKEHPLSDETVPQSFRLEWDRIKALRQKSENIQSESERIHMKGDAESDTLSAGQLKKLERNEEHLATLQELIYAKESELHQKMFPNTNEGRKRKRDLVNDDIEEDDDDYLDRTKDDYRGNMKLNQDGETEESLLLKWEDLQTQHTDVSNKMKSLDQKLSLLKQSSRGMEEEEDLFFVRNELDVLHDTRAKLEREEKRLFQNLNDVEVLIRVVNPKLRKVGGGSTWAMPERSDVVNCSVPSEGKSGMLSIENFETTEGRTSKAMVIEQLNHLERQYVSSSKPTGAFSSVEMLPPPPKRRDANTSSTPKVGTLAFLPSSVYADMTGDRTLRPADVAEVALNNEQQQDEWQIPRDQDGSGRTKLNAKFAGRY
jgi:FHA domain